MPTINVDIKNRWTGNVQLGARLRQVLSYDPATGDFLFRERVAQRVHVGGRAGGINSEGYRHIRVDGRQYKAHRLAWFFVHGEWPADLIDHINGDRDDNRIANLRIANRSQNLANSRVFRRGKSLPKGVSFRKAERRWIARIQLNGVSEFLGYFETPDAAAAAYTAKATELFGLYARAS